MAYLSREEIAKIGFKSYGENLQISSKATFYRPERISLGNNIKIDDFAVLANYITLSDYIFIGIGSHLLASGNAPITLENFSTLAYRVMIITSSDDYSGEFMTNPTIPDSFRGCYEKKVNLNKHAIIGANSMIMPGCDIAEGVAIGAMSLVTKPTKEWGIYAGNPARRIKERSKNLLDLEKQFLKSLNPTLKNSGANPK
ncbi:hypothetical protein CCY99_09125 [Helicobacter sp. 16-1353]|nr:hypothetical protein CCY99_09125 [Helicobacter sp. 16-1353]